jgi:hypothetical protein
MLMFKLTKLPTMNNLALSSDLVTTYCIIDDLVALLKLKTISVGRRNSLNMSEIATISLLRMKYDIRTWKGIYKLLKDTKAFTLPCYKNFVMTMNSSAADLALLICILLQLNRRKSGRIKIVDSMPVPVCKNIRIWYHKTMKNHASRGKYSGGWYYGVKLHAVCDTKGNLIAFKFTTASVNDRKVLGEFLDILSDSIVVADAGYISGKLEKKAADRGNILKTCSRSNMKKLATSMDIGHLNLRLRVETLFSILKERLNIVTSLPRSVLGYIAHYIHVIFGYMFNKLIS